MILHKANTLSPAMEELWSYPKLLDVMEQLVGPEVAGQPVFNLRVKVPNNEPEVVPWHQVNTAPALKELWLKSVSHQSR